MTATDELRRLLDERGVEYVGTHQAFTAWWGDHDLYWSAMEVYDGELDLGTNMSNVSPEQAIDATLGRGTCQVKGSIIDTYEYNRWEYELSCGHTIIWEDSEPPNYCPNCGAKVVDPTTNDVDAEVDA